MFLQELSLVDITVSALQLVQIFIGPFQKDFYTAMLQCNVIGIAIT